MKKYLSLLCLVLMLRVYWEQEGMFSKEIDKGSGIVVNWDKDAWFCSVKDDKDSKIYRIQYSRITKSEWVDIK